MRISNLEEIQYLSNSGDQPINHLITTSGFDFSRQSAKLDTNVDIRYKAISHNTSSNSFSHKPSLTSIKRPVLIISNEEEHINKKSANNTRAEFSKEDIKYLLQLVSSKSFTNKLGQNSWDIITNKFNLEKNKNNTVDQIKNCYNNSKRLSIISEILVDNIPQTLSNNSIIQSSSSDDPSNYRFDDNSVQNNISCDDESNTQNIIEKKKISLKDLDSVTLKSSCGKEWTDDESEILKDIKNNHINKVSNGGSGYSLVKIQKQYIHLGRMKVLENPDALVFHRDLQQIKNRLKYLKRSQSSYSFY